MQEIAVRQAAFDFLGEASQAHDEVIPRSVLQAGFEIGGERVPLVGPQGIFKPRLLEFPLSITTAPPSSRKEAPYDDSHAGPGFLKYCYRASDPRHRDNEGLRQCMKRKLPLAYLLGISPGRYLAQWPVFIVDDVAGSRSFHVSMDEIRVNATEALQVADSGSLDLKEYRTAAAKVRLHQRAFRERVLSAYRRCCALCRLRHEELLEAAHILPDCDPRSLPVASNGIALCNLHHAAFDQRVLGIRPDLTVHIRPDVLEEVDGPMLLHGLQGFHGKPLSLPARAVERPNPAHIAERYAAFLRAS